MLFILEMTLNPQTIAKETQLDCGCAYEKRGRSLKVLNRCPSHELMKLSRGRNYKWITSADGRHFFEGARMYRCGCIYPKGVDPPIYRCPIHEAFVTELHAESWTKEFCTSTWSLSTWAAFISTCLVGTWIVGVLIAIVMGAVTLIIDVFRKLGY